MNNSSNLNFFKSLKTNGFQPEAIKAEDLLNILWLSNPNILTALKSKDLIDIGITRLISCTLNDSFPRASVLREFEENIQKYAPMELTDNDILRIASRVANKALSNIDELNALAESNQKAFVDRLKKEAAIEKAREESTNQKLREFIDKLNQKQLALEKLTSHADEKVKALDQRSEEFRKNEEAQKKRESESKQKVESITTKYESEKRQRISLMNEKIAEQRKKYISKRVFEWRLKTFGYLFIGLVIFVSAIIYAYYLGDWGDKQAQQIFEQYKTNLVATALLWLASAIFTGFLIKRFSDQFSASNINSFKIGVEKELPKNLKDVLE